MSRRSFRSELVFALLVLVACGQKDARPTTAPTDASRPDGDATPSTPAATAGETEAGAPLAWPDAIRAGKWADAADGLAALAAPEQAKPEVRLARARVAIAQKRHADALKLLEGLDDQLPLLRELVGKLRAQAAFEVGPFDKAAAFFEGRRDTTSLVLAAEAWEKMGDATRAKVAWDRVLASDKRSRSQEEKARSKRMQIVRLKEGDPAAQADARWLTIHALDDKVFSDAAELLEKLTPPKLLTSEELIKRAKILADASRSEEALRTLERAHTRGPIAPVELCRLRADIYWKSHRYADAALAYRTCAGMGGARAAEDAFMSARAFSRGDRDADAVPAFQAVMQKHPRTPWAEQAEFHLARIHALAGRWKDATAAFDEWARKFPSGKDKREADRYRAIAHLASHNDKKARKLLEDLSGGAEDQVTAARWTNLAALAAYRDGDKLHAMARWADVVRTRPLTYPALIARARIREHGGTPPPSIEPAESGGPAPIKLELPEPANMLHRIGLDREAEDTLKEREAAVVATNPSRGTEALCTAFGLVDRAKRRFQIALQIPIAQVSTAPSAKNRAQWDCLFPRPHEGLVRTASARAKVSTELIWSVMRQESNFDPDVVSPARAVGLMQLLPETATATAKAKGIAHDDSMLTSPAQNIMLGALYLREMLDHFDDNASLAVAAYNGGPEAIRRWIKRMKDISLDIFVEAIPFIETRGYVSRVMGNLARYGFLDRGESGVPAIPLTLTSKE